MVLLTFICAFVVILLGAYTRLTNAGLSCPDWPHCYGFLTAPYTQAQLQTAINHYPLSPIDIKKAWTEMTHRYAAGTEGILILILSGSILFAKKAKDGKSIMMSLILIALLSVQVLLGMLTVTALLKPIIVLSHLFIGLSILSLLWWMYLDRHLSPHAITKTTSASLIPWLWLALIIIFVQILLGGWVSTHYAGLACIDFPYCNGEWLPKLAWNNINTDLITIHMLHRLGAMVTGIYLSVLAFALFTYPSFRAIATFILALIALQITLGILNIVWLRPVWLALIHQAVAILLLLTAITILVKAYLGSRDNPYDLRIT
ncbi:MAG: hypothetical protein A3F11_08950 [Gammaproteobacteria bacterium RIFCSPHIGHO2_12_FULL_37_14]|nr:MAG: hypothetical protein A3F11_08950 [Gammaproteobacteria bacterium RIFCSPHIGHO2_12_FULL_37_14]